MKKKKYNKGINKSNIKDSELETFIPNEYKDKLGVYNKVLYVKETAGEEIIKIANSLGIQFREIREKTNNNFIVAKESKEGKLKDYKIYGSKEGLTNIKKKQAKII